MWPPVMLLKQFIACLRSWRKDRPDWYVPWFIKQDETMATPMMETAWELVYYTQTIGVLHVIDLYILYCYLLLYYKLYTSYDNCMNVWGNNVFIVLKMWPATNRVLSRTYLFCMRVRNSCLDDVPSILWFCQKCLPYDPICHSM